MSDNFLTWGIPAIAVLMGAVLCVWGWWGSRRFARKYPDSSIADSYTWKPVLPLPTDEGKA
jgi:hypothetical protein